MWRTYTVTNTMPDDYIYSDAKEYETIEEAIQSYGFTYYGDVEDDVTVYEFIEGNVRYVFRKVRE